MIYTDEQQKIADWAINYLREQGNVLHQGDLWGAVKEQFGDGNFAVDQVSAILREDGFIRNEGDLVMLTPLASEKVRQGVMQYVRSQDWKARAKIAKDVIAVVAALCTILTAIVSFIVDYIVK